MEKKLKEVIVVEGKEDTRRIQLAVNADTIETNGSAIDQATIDQIKHAHEIRGVIVFTDPDFPGEKIRKTISDQIPGIKHAFLTVDEARPKSKGSLGIEHADLATIRQSLQGLYQEQLGQARPIARKFFYEKGLIGSPQASDLRRQLGDKLRIGYTNGKQLQKRLQLFGISEDQVNQALIDISAERKKSPDEKY